MQKRATVRGITTPAKGSGGRWTDGVGGASALLLAQPALVESLSQHMAEQRQALPIELVRHEPTVEYTYEWVIHGCFYPVFDPFSAVLSPFLRAVRLPGVKTERTRQRRRKMGEKWPKSWCRNTRNHTYTPPLEVSTGVGLAIGTVGVVGIVTGPALRARAVEF